MAIITHLARSYQELQTGRRPKESLESITLGAWSKIRDDKADEFGDVVIGVYKNTIVSAYDIVGWKRDDEDKITFHGEESAEFAHLIGTPSPVTWSQGQARPVRYLDTAILRGGDVDVVKGTGGKRAVIGNVTVTATSDDTVVVVVSPGTTVIVQSLSPSEC